MYRRLHETVGLDRKPNIMASALGIPQKHTVICSSTHSPTFLSDYPVPGASLGLQETAGNKTGKISVFVEIVFE